MAPERHRAARWWLGAGVLVLLGAMLSPRAVPLFDGVGFPDQPYRFVARPAGSPPTPAPTTAELTTPVLGGTSRAGLTVNTAEQGPQLSVFVPLGSLAASDGSVTVRATPLAPTDPPTGVTVDGNVYRISFTASAGGPVTLTAAGSVGLLVLRATTARQPGPVVEHRGGPGAPWRQLPTTRGGQDIYSARFLGAGDYTLAFLPATGGGGVPVLALVLGPLVLLLAGVVVVVRRRSAREQA